MMAKKQNKRKDYEPPFAISQKRMKFHHIGVPTKEKNQMKSI
jgi:hypothetical protein